MATLRRPDIPVITHVRELDRVFTAISQTENLTATLRLTNRFIANSNATKDSLVRSHRVPPEKVDVVYPFIACAPGIEADSSAEIRRHLGLRPDDKLVVGCGTVHARKGTDLFIEVAGAVVSRRIARDVRFVWVGGDTTELTCKDMQKRAIERGLSDVVSFIGHRTDYIDFLAAADLLLLTSREEPFGRVILEAGLFATPTVCFAGSGGAPEFIRDDAGRVVARENVDAMAIAAIELLDSAAITASLGARARERVVHEHSIEVGAPRIWNIVERAIAEHALG